MTIYTKLINAEINGTSFLKSGLRYKWDNVKASGDVFNPNTNKAMMEITDKRKIIMSSFDGTIKMINQTVQVWDKGKRNEDKELVLRHFPEFTKKELDILDKISGGTLSSIIQSVKPVAKPIKPVTKPMNPFDLNEIALIASDFESSDTLQRHGQAA